MRLKPVPARLAIICLTIVSLVGWRIWITPRIDKRLIGQWQCTTATADRQFVTLYLRGDGRGKYTWQEDGTACVEDYPWVMSGSTLQVRVEFDRNEYATGLWRLVDAIGICVMTVWTEKSCEAWKVLSVGSDELLLRQRSNSAVLTFKRVPSGLDP